MTVDEAREAYVYVSMEDLDPIHYVCNEMRCFNDSQFAASMWLLDKKLFVVEPGEEYSWVFDTKLMPRDVVLKLLVVRLEAPRERAKEAQGRDDEMSERFAVSECRGEDDKLREVSIGDVVNRTKQDYVQGVACINVERYSEGALDSLHELIRLANVGWNAELYEQQHTEIGEDERRRHRDEFQDKVQRAVAVCRSNRVREEGLERTIIRSDFYFDAKRLVKARKTGFDQLTCFAGPGQGGPSLCGKGVAVVRTAILDKVTCPECREHPWFKGLAAEEPATKAFGTGIMHYRKPDGHMACDDGSTKPNEGATTVEANVTCMQCLGWIAAMKVEKAVLDSVGKLETGPIACDLVDPFHGSVFSDPDKDRPIDLTSPSLLLSSLEAVKRDVGAPVDNPFLKYADKVVASRTVFVHKVKSNPIDGWGKETGAREERIGTYSSRADAEAAKQWRDACINQFGTHEPALRHCDVGESWIEEEQVR
jgi:hypothetical protein